MIPLLLLLQVAGAHDFRPAVLEVREETPARWAMRWTNPGPLSATLDGCRRQTLWQCDRPDQVRVSGFTPASQVLVVLDPLDGTPQQQLLHPDTPSWSPSHVRGAADVLVGYGRLGIEHILLGFDHLLFVLGLTVIVRGTGPLVKTLTAFTVAHSVTLAGTTLGWVSLPSPPVEAVIALSIVLLGRELCTPQKSLVSRYPWVVAFGFGLLHGFGFAGALAELGLPESARGLALLAFNLGVEAGQLVFVGVLGIVAALTGIGRDRVGLPVGYGIGILAAAWTLDRILGF